MMDTHTTELQDKKNSKNKKIKQKTPKKVKISEMKMKIEDSFRDKNIKIYSYNSRGFDIIKQKYCQE